MTKNFGWMSRICGPSGNQPKKAFDSEDPGSGLDHSSSRDPGSKA